MRLNSIVSVWRSKFMADQTKLTVKRLVVPATVALLLTFLQPVIAALNDDLRLQLQTSRDALILQEKDISKSYDDVTRQIDALRKKQALLDSYLKQTRDAIRDVERAMGNTK